MDKEIKAWLLSVITNKVGFADDEQIIDQFIEDIKPNNNTFELITDIYCYETPKFCTIDVYVTQPHKFKSVKFETLAESLCKTFNHPVYVYLKTAELDEVMHEYGNIKNKAYFEQLVVAELHNKILMSTLKNLDEEHKARHLDYIDRADLSAKQVIRLEEERDELKKEISRIMTEGMKEKVGFITLGKHHRLLKEKSDELLIIIKRLTKEKSELARKIVINEA